MKKLILSLLVFSISLAFVFAQGPMGEAPEEIPAKMIKSANNASMDNLSRGMEYSVTEGLALMQRAREGNFMDEKGMNYRIEESEKGYKLQLQNRSINCSDCNLTQRTSQNRTSLGVALSNGRNAQIKVMPETASENALKQLRLRVCNESCEIELKEVGKGNESKLAYEIKTQKQAKVFGLFKAKMDVAAQVDAETGEAIKTKRPWWSFLASEKKE